jgi:thioester reductase-like protein
MPLLLMTGFPGFLGSALLPRLLQRREDASAVCLVQPQHRTTAEERVAAIAAEHPHTRGRILLVDGDVTASDLGVGHEHAELLAQVTEVWHLAAVYDLAVGPEVAQRVNVEGTARVLDFCRSRGSFHRLHHVSTCYVSGSYDGTFTEDALTEGQGFRNHYEATKYDAEVLVRKAMADGLPATVYRPGIVVGDSRTGATQKYDGPYFFASYLSRLPFVSVVPSMKDPDEVRVCLVPRDFVVDAMDVLSVQERSLGRTYALTDPRPPTARRLVEVFARHLGRRVLWAPLPLGATRTVVASVPGLERLLGLPAEALDYFVSPTVYDTTNVTTDLEGTGVACPPFESYADRLLDFMREHPEIDAKAMT